MRKVLSILGGVAMCVAGHLNANAEEDPYAALQDILSIKTKTIGASDCHVVASLDFVGFVKHLGVFRDGWLNMDQSLDFYNQRRKEVFVFIIAKRAAELLTEGIYRKSVPTLCSFVVVTKYNDIYGSPTDLELVSWTFDETTNKKVNWDKIDPRDFSRFALNYTITPGAMTWISDEPSILAPDQPDINKTCPMDMLRANAIFVRASTYCATDYMDTKAGAYALEHSKPCRFLSKEKLDEALSSSFRELDLVVKQNGKEAACRWVDDITKQVLRSAEN